MFLIFLDVFDWANEEEMHFSRIGCGCACGCGCGCGCGCRRQAFAAAEVNARRRRSVVAKGRLLHAACAAFPEPWFAVDDLDLFAGKQLFARGLGGCVLAPCFEMNEHLVVGLPALVDLGNHVNSLHCAEIQLFNHVEQVFAGRALEHSRNANAGLLFVLRFLALLIMVLRMVAENVGRIWENFF